MYIIAYSTKNPGASKLLSKYPNSQIVLHFKNFKEDSTSIKREYGIEGRELSTNEQELLRKQKKII